ncbi:hypothetical protein C8J57DRAFT_1492432 [Mycena rebaudengoi]|nr:hypothetical protein C8J57DRAFT_1492432 [Mycena rebaudengoi]
MGWLDDLREGVKEVANDATMIVAQGYRSTAGEVQEFVKHPDPIRVVKAPLNIVGDMAERWPGVVGDLAHSLRNPPPGDRSNWMRENKAHLENKRLYQISLASHPPGTHDSGTFDLSLRDALDAANTVSGLSKYPLTAGVVHDWAKAQELDFDNSTRVSAILICESASRSTTNLADQHPDEVIILDIQHSHGLEDKPDCVQDLIATFRDIFTGLYVTKSRLEQHPTYAELIKSRDRAVILCDNKNILSSKADYFIPRDEFFDAYDWSGRPIGGRPANDDNKMYGIWMSFSPTENPSTADEYTTFATSSLRKWGAEKQNPLAIGRLSKLQLGGRGWMIILDFPEYPNMENEYQLTPFLIFWPIPKRLRSPP